MYTFLGSLHSSRLPLLAMGCAGMFILLSSSLKLVYIVFSGHPNAPYIIRGVMPYPVLKVSEMKLDFDIKEFRLAEMQRTVNPKTAASAVLQAMHELADEVKIEGKMA